MIKVSVLMNAYNSEKYLREAIDSVYGQTYQDWEIIFIDNCSTDATKEIVDSYDSKVKYYKTKKNIPLGEARNFGLQFCNREYIAFLDTDDIWLDEKLEKQINILDKNRAYKLCYGGVVTIDEQGKEMGKFLPKTKNNLVFSQQLKRYEINMQTVVMRNDIEIFFNDKMQFSPDFDLFMRIVSEYPTFVISEYLVKYRKSKDSLTTKSVDRWWIETKDTLDYIFLRNPSLKVKYAKEYQFAYAKNSYYKAIVLINKNDIGEAKRALSQYKFLSFKYFILYASLHFSISFWNFIHRFK